MQLSSPAMDLQVGILSAPPTEELDHSLPCWGAEEGNHLLPDIRKTPFGSAARQVTASR